MASINKKVWPEYFEQIISGKKTYELRLNNFDVNEGDTLTLEEWSPQTKSYTGRKVEKTVSHVGKFTIEDLEKFWSREEILLKGIQVISIK